MRKNHSDVPVTLALLVFAHDQNNLKEHPFIRAAFNN